MGPLPFLSPADAPERKKEMGPRCGDGGARSGGSGGARCVSHAILIGLLTFTTAITKLTTPVNAW
jgi:hypothetical protein